MHFDLVQWSVSEKKAPLRLGMPSRSPVPALKTPWSNLLPAELLLFPHHYPTVWWETACCNCSLLKEYLMNSSWGQVRSLQVQSSWGKHPVSRKCFKISPRQAQCTHACRVLLPFVSVYARSSVSARGLVLLEIDIVHLLLQNVFYEHFWETAHF